MVHQDNPAISGQMYLLRRIPPWAERVTWDESGIPNPSSQNFSDPDEELSVNIENETTPEEVLEGLPGFGLMRFPAHEVREACGDAAIICRDPPPPSHVLICGKITRGMRTKLKKASSWVRFPKRIDPITGVEPAT